jgi:alkyl hydroperoxide reductase subunit AhpC
MARDYGVLLEKEGLDLQGMFLIDGQSIVQQVRMVFIPVLSRL